MTKQELTAELRLIIKRINKYHELYKEESDKFTVYRELRARELEIIEQLIMD